MHTVSVATSYSVAFWAVWGVILIVLIGLTAGAALLLLPFLFWYKQAVINRNQFLLEKGAKRMMVKHGRWFVVDDDRVAISAIDNIKLNRSMFGAIFGWCTIVVETRSEVYPLAHASSKEATAFREVILAE